MTTHALHLLERDGVDGVDLRVHGLLSRLERRRRHVVGVGVRRRHRRLDSKTNIHAN